MSKLKFKTGKKKYPRIPKGSGTRKTLKKLDKSITKSGRDKINEIVSALNNNPNLTQENFFKTIEENGRKKFPELKVEEIDMVKAMAYASWIKGIRDMNEEDQLANIDLQNTLEKQQQAMNMMSNLSKQARDIAMAVIRKIR